MNTYKLSLMNRFRHMYRLGLRRTLRQVLQSMPAGFKLLGLILFSTVFILLHNIVWLSSVALVMVLVWLIVRTEHMVSWQKMWPLALSFGVIFLYMAWVSGLQEGFVALFRLIALWAAAQTVMLTTSTTAMMQVVETVVTPFSKLFRANPARIALLFGLTIRLMPLMVQQWHEVREAQQARGVKVKAHNMLVPMLVRTLNRAQALTDAIDARQLGETVQSKVQNHSTSAHR
jgi:biotin transport system permease protein